jgi:hypothetical protein
MRPAPAHHSAGTPPAGAPEIVVAAGASTAIALPVARVIMCLVARSRPAVAHPAAVHVLTADAPDTGFPNGPALAGFAKSATEVLLRNRRCGLLGLVAAVRLSAGRVAIGVDNYTAP